MNFVYPNSHLKSYRKGFSRIISIGVYKIIKLKNKRNTVKKSVQSAALIS